MTLILGACASSFSEKHYFKSAIADPSKPSAQGGSGSADGAKIPNYFRLTVSGYTWLSSSRYVSGYYDDATLAAYFNEFTQPAGGRLAGNSAPTSDSASAKATSGNGGAPKANDVAPVQPLGQSLQGKQLVLILSSNSDEIANQIGALAANNQLTSSLVGLLARGDFTAADDAERTLALDAARAKTAADLGARLLTALSAGLSKDQVESQLLPVANTLAADLGHQGNFKDLKDLADWLGANRERVRGTP